MEGPTPITIDNTVFCTNDAPVDALDGTSTDHNIRCGGSIIYKLRIIGDTCYVHGTSDSVANPGPGIPVVSFKGIREVYIGRDPVTTEETSVLLRLRAGICVVVGCGIIMFRPPEPPAVFYAPYRKDTVIPYSYIVTDNYVVMPLARKYIRKADFPDSEDAILNGKLLDCVISEERVSWLDVISYIDSGH